MRSAAACLALLLTLLPTQPLLAVELKDILNYHFIDESLSSAGQVQREHIEAVAEAGFELVINLGPADKDYNEDEGFMISEQGIAYVNIPVIWDAPTQQDLQLFFDIMDARGARKTLVHCYANYRASAFTYLYRVLQLGVPEAEARERLDAVWSDEAFAAYPMWRELIDDALAGNFAISSAEN